MHIIEEGPIEVSYSIKVHSHGHVYHAVVAELKGVKARCLWMNKSGNKFDKWLTIPSKSEKKTNPLAAQTRKLRAAAAARIRHNTYRDRDIAFITEAIVQYEALLAANEPLPVLAGVSKRNKSETAFV